jgi:chromosome segregation protein
MQESQGTRATQLLLDSGMRGIEGLVAQLGRVDPRYQLALEMQPGAAGLSWWLKTTGWPPRASSF